MYNEQEIVIDDMVNKVFVNTPKPEKSIYISLDSYGLKDSFEMLLTFFVDGMKIKYGDNNEKVNLDSLTYDDFNYLNKCMNSIGVKVDLDIVSHIDYLIKYNNFKDYSKIVYSNSTTLKDLKVSFFTELKCYIINFDLC